MLLIRHKVSLGDHPTDLLTVGKARRLYLFRLKDQSIQVDVTLDQKHVVKATREIHGHQRTDFGKVVTDTEFLEKLAFSRLLRALPRKRASARRDVPANRSTLLERLTLLHEHFPFGVEEANVDDQVVITGFD